MQFLSGLNFSPGMSENVLELGTHRAGIQKKMWKRKRHKPKAEILGPSLDFSKENLVNSEDRRLKKSNSELKRKDEMPKGKINSKNSIESACVVGFQGRHSACSNCRSDDYVTHGFPLVRLDHEKSTEFHRSVSKLYCLPRDASLDCQLQYVYMSTVKALSVSSDS